MTLPSFDDPDVILSEALATRDAGRAEQGIEQIRAALQRHPRHPALWQVLGLLNRALGESGAAAEALREAARLAPHDTRIAHALARVTMEAGLPSLALFDQARRLAPFDGDLLISRAAAQLSEGEGHQAIEEIDALLLTSPNWLQGHELLANMRWQLGERERFTAGYERALAADPRNLALWLALIGRFIHAEMFAEADDAIGRARRSAGAHIALDANEAICASEVGDLSRADRLFASLAAIPDDGVGVRHVRHLLRTGRIEEAARRAEPLTAGPEAAMAWPYLAVAWRLLADERCRWLEDDPRLVGVHDIVDPAEIEALADCLRTLHNTQSHPIGQSVLGGTQTDGPLFARIDPPIRDLRDRIVRAVKEHVSAFAPCDPRHPVLRCGGGAPVRFAGSWSVRLSGAGYHTQHVHQQGWISSAFYVVVPDAGEMGPQPAGWLSLGQPPPELGIDLPPLHLIEPKPGRLALFPSIMWHGTVPFEGGERLTVAFDVAAPKVAS